MDNFKKFNNENLLKEAGSFGIFHLLLIFSFILINTTMALTFFSEEIWEYSDNMNCLSDHNNLTMILKTFYTPNGYWHIKYFTTFANEFDANCIGGWRSNFLKCTFTFGFLMGTLVLGYCGDKYGRMVAFKYASILQMFGTLITILSPSIIIHFLSRFLIGFSINANFTMMYILVIEYTQTSLRTYVLNITIGVFYTAARIMATWLAFNLSNWRYYVIITSLLQSCVLVSSALIPESYQWFGAEGLIHNSIRALKIVACYNKKHIKETIENTMRRYAIIELLRIGNYSNVNSLITERKLRNRIIIAVLKSILVAISLEIMSEKIHFQGRLIFLTISTLSITNFPAAFFMLLIEKYGRNFISIGMLIFGIIYIPIVDVSLTFLQCVNDPKYSIFKLLSISVLKVILLINFQQAAEFLPTTVRSQGLCLLNLGTIIGFNIGVQCYKLQWVYPWFPEITSGTLLLIAVLITFLLPETLGKRLPITLQEALCIQHSNELSVYNDSTYHSYKEDLDISIRTRISQMNRHSVIIDMNVTNVSNDRIKKNLTKLKAKTI